MEAKLLCGNGFTTPPFKKIFSTDPVDRRKAIKALVYKIPGRPFAMFFALYIVKGGFLDGRAGLIFSLLRAFYEFMINCKVRELKDG